MTITAVNHQADNTATETSPAAIEAAAARAHALPTAQQLTISDAAVKHLQHMFTQEPAALGLRLGLKKSGCSGFAYEMDYCMSVDADDHAFERDGVRVFVKEAHLAAIAGSELDFVVEGLTRMLHVNNPNVEDSCGCGESFTLRD